MKKIKRKYFVDLELQGPMLGRLLVYWFFGMLFISMPAALVYTFLQPDMNFLLHVVQVWKMHWPIFLMLTVSLPFVLYDMLKFSNRFAGPMFRLRRELGKVVNDGEFSQFKTREKDFWKDIVVGFNHLAERVQSLEEQLETEKPQKQVGAKKAEHEPV